jgi:short-subunit dehydrogenase
MPRKDSGDTIAIRLDGLYKQRLFPVYLDDVEYKVIRQEGVYIIAGGTGGIGESLSKYLAANYHARLVLVGRSKSANKTDELINDIVSLGGEAIYVQADIGSLSDMKIVVEAAKSRFKSINGAVHSALVLNDGAIPNLSIEEFNRALLPKINGSMAMYEALKNEKIDFILYFSSANSFIGNAGQSNYVAASAFQDKYAKHLNKQSSFPVKVINWGYWGDVGVVANDFYRKKMSNMGIGSISVAEGMKAIETILNIDSDQLIFFKGEKNALKTLGVFEDKTAYRLNENVYSVFDELVKVEMV